MKSFTAFRSTLGLLTAGTSLFSLPTQAQTTRFADQPAEDHKHHTLATPASALDRFEVWGARERDYAATVSSGAGKTLTPLIETPQAVSIITHYQIQDQAAQTMQEVLRYSAGVRAEMYGLDNRGDWFSLRGGSEGSTVLNSLRLPLTGWYGVVRNEPYAFERVEVLRGPSSVMVGQNGPGGVVNLVSKRPQPQSQGELTVQYGSFDHRLAAFDVTGPTAANDHLLYRVVGFVKDSGTQIHLADEQREYLAPSVTWRFNDSGSFTLYTEYQRDESENTNAFLPWAGTIHPAPSGPIPTDVFIGEPAWDSYGGRRLRVGYEFEHRLHGNWRLRQNIRYDDVSGHLRSMYANFWETFLADERSLNRTWYASENSNRIFNADLTLEGIIDAGRLRHTLLLGIDALTTRDQQANLSGAATPLDVYTPTYGTFPLPGLAFGPAAITRTRQYGVILQDQIKVDEQWVVVGTLRGDDARTTVDGSNAGGSDDQAVSSRLGVVYLAPRGWAPYVSFAESFEPVSGADAAGDAYEPKRGRQIEAGLKWALRDGRIAASAAAYHLVEKNRLTSDPNIPFNSIQGGEVTVQGIEFESTATLGAVSFVAHYTYTDAKTTRSSDPNDPALNKRLVSIPEHSAALWAVQSFETGAFSGLRLGAGIRYVGATWDGTDSLRTASNTLYDALVSYERERWRLSLNAINVFDKEYVVTALSRGDSWFGSRRKLIASLTYRW